MARFATTRWSLILDARQPQASRAALEEICRAYRYPVLMYVRHRGYPMADAEDLTQEFFARLLEGRWDVTADPQRGHFRAFLLTALKRFLISAGEASNAQKRGGGMQRVETTNGFDMLAGDDRDRPDHVFERAWAVTVLERGFERLQAEAENAGKSELFQQLSPYVAEQPLPDDYQRIAQQLGLRTNTVAVAVHRLRARLRDLVREELFDTCNDAAGVETELRALRDVLGHPSA